MSTSTQTSCYVMVILGWGWVGWGGAITFMSTCTHTSCYVMVIFSWTKQMRRTPFFSVHCGDANRWQMVERPERLCSQKLSKTVVSWSQHKRAPWIGKVCLGLLLAKIFGTIDTSPISRRTLQGRQSNEALLRRRKKVLHPKKTRTYVKKRSSFGDFQNPIFHVSMRKNDVPL